jgi:eukaryotic-like serine/threonine-protein kinase
MTSSATTIADRYQLVRRLGEGAMGAVWLALDTALRREVAIKSVHGPLVDQDSHSTAGAQRALREARLIARVNHPNAVSIFDVVLHEGRPWLVMEYLPSLNLAEVVRRDGPLSPARVADLGAQVAAALTEAHRVGVVHRDVKPANILLADKGGAKITDFGIARGDGEVTLTATGQMWGTPAYFAPELAQGHPPSPKADVWALGATLYFAVEGTPPYGTDSNPLGMLGRIAHQPVPRPQHAGALTPVLEQLLARDPQDRPSMHQAAALLRAAAADADLPATSVLPPTGAPPQPGGTWPAGERSQADESRQTDERSQTGELPQSGMPPHPPTTSQHVPGSEDRRRSRLWPLVLVAGLAAAGLVIWLLLGLDGDGQGSGQSSGQTAGPEASQSDASPDRQGSQPEQTPTKTTPPAEPSDTPNSPDKTGEPFTADAMTGAVVDYYALMPDNTEDGFERLGPTLRAQGFEAYDEFWDGIESVSVSDLRADPASRTVDATVVFVTKDGRTSTESHQFGLVPDESGDGLLIDTDTLV